MSIKPEAHLSHVSETHPDRSVLHFPHLDGLRGLAVLIVVVGHYSIFSPTLGPVIGPTAKTGVWLFFLLSAFLLTRQTISVYTDGPTLQNTLRYFSRRVLRILPLYYVLLVLLVRMPTFALHMFGRSDFSLLDHFFLMYPQGIFWAISVEFEYYAIIPIIALAYTFLIRVHRSLGPFLGLVLLFLAVVNYRWAWFQKGFPANYPHLGNYTHFFLAGSAIAIFFQYRNVIRFSTERVAALAFAGALAWQIFVIPFPFRDSLLAKLGVPLAWWHWMAQHPGQLISCATILCSILLSDRLRKIFSAGWLRFFGKISFSLYCLHILPTAYLGCLVPLTGPYLAVVGFFILSVAGSVLTYRLIELPCMELVRGAVPPSRTNRTGLARSSAGALTTSTNELALN